MTETDLRRTALDIALTFGRQFLGGLFQLGTVLVVARHLGKEGAGNFAVALLLPTVMAQLLNFGLSAANVYFVASREVTAAEAWAATRDFMIPIAASGTLVSAILVMVAGEAVFPGVDRLVLFAALAILPGSLLVSSVAGIFQALQDFRAFNVTVVVQPAMAFFCVLALWLVVDAPLETFVAAIAVTHGVGFIIALVLLSQHVPILAAAPDRLNYLRRAFSYGAKVHLGNMLSFLNYRVDLFLVNLFAGPAAAGLYTVAVRLVEQLWMISQAVSTVILPRLSAMADDEAARTAFTPVVVRSVLCVTLATSVGLAMLSKPLIRWLFGAEFTPAALALLILLPGVVLFSVARVLANDLAARGMVGVNLMLALVVFFANTGMNVLLIPRYGVLGAALATSLAYGLVLAARLVIHTRLTSVRVRDLLIPTRDDVARLGKVLRKKKDT